MAIDLSFLGAQSDAADASAYTFAATGLGAAADDRLIVLTIHARSTTTADSVPTGATVAGVTATELVSHTDTDGFGPVSTSLFVAEVPAGTTGDVVLTFSGTQLRCLCGVYRLVGAEAAAFDSATKNEVGGAAISAGLDVVAGGAVIAGVSGSSSVITPFSWTGPTEQYDTLVESMTTSGAMEENSSSELNRVVTATPGGGSSLGRSVLAIVSFEPTPDAGGRGMFKGILGNGIL